MLIDEIMRVRSFHRLGPCALACGVLWLAACNDRRVGGEGDDGPPEDPHPHEPVPLYINHDVDILFVIDDSGSMAQEQNRLARDFAAFVAVLERPEVAANYRIGITTTDDGNPWCTDTTPPHGALQLASCRGRPEEFVLEGVGIPTIPEACVDTCPEALTELETLPSPIAGSTGNLAPRPWLERTEGRTNLREGLDVVQAFGCVGPQGIRGCGFESPLEAMWKALTRAQAEGNPDFGFMRERAILSIVHLTDEEDCSPNPEFESIFLPEGDRVFWSDPAAEAPTSALCWNAGVACEGAGPYECRPVDRDVDGNEVAAADADERAVLRPVSHYVDFLQEIENHKQTFTPDQQLLVSLIAGVGSGGAVTYQDGADPQFQRDFGMGPGCVGEGGAAVPPVRLRALAEAFAVGGQPSMVSVCDDDYAPALAAIAEAISAQIKPACFPGCVADTDPSTPAVLDPACTITQEWPRGDGTYVETEVPACEADGVVPEGADACYVTLTGGERGEFCRDAGFNLELRLVRREGVPAPADTIVFADCEPSDDAATDCPELP
jgi:hypothetical protein